MAKCFLTFAIAVLIFAGCASDDDTAAPTTMMPTTAAPTTTTAAPITMSPTTASLPPTTTSLPPATTTSQPETRDDLVDIAAGIRHTCALLASGSVSCWGENESGQLGNGESGSNVYSTVPVRVQNITDAVAMGAGWEHACAVHATGEVSCWGDNSRGELGNGEESGFQPLPVKVGDIDDAVAVTAGHWHTCALRESGSISCWGANHDGQLGNGGDEDGSAVPVDVADISDAVAVSAGGEHTCALHSTGEISCWGDNWRGELGNGQVGNEYDSSVPVKVSGIDDATSVSSGDWHTCAVHEDGNVSCWGEEQGSNQFGQVFTAATPVGVPSFGDAVSVSAGSGHTCAIRESRSISCWGANTFGQLGNLENQPFSLTPVAVQGIDDATALTTGTGHTCAIRESSGAVCWGTNNHGQLGHGQDSGISYEKVRVAGIDNAVNISAASSHTCVAHDMGEVSCWGSNWRGQAPRGESSISLLLPVKIDGITTASAVSSDTGVTCATLEGGEASCWGFYWNNNLVENDDGSISPVPAMWQNEDTSDITRIETGGSHACALHEDRTITCAGANWYGNLGNGEFGTSISWAPVKVVGIDDAIDVSLGLTHTCAVHATGEASCWGRNDDGQLGNGTDGSENNSNTPVKVLGITDAVGITAGNNSLTCVLHATGEVSCWGSNAFSELSSNSRGAFSSADHSSVPVKIEGITDATSVTAGYSHACVLHETGDISCWGSNILGELGTGGHIADDQTATPQKVEGITDATAVSAGFVHTCALHESGEITCWGWDDQGQLGDGQAFDNTNSYTPVKVFGL